jgi:UDP-N-acetylglucosamine transferase subunit ALG13
MIYLTVGTYREGFDRLVKAVDTLCGKHHLECIAQTGESSYKPAHMIYSNFYPHKEHHRNIANSEFVITHGGFGVIGDIMRLGKPLLVVPRKPSEAGHDQREMAIRLARIYEFGLCLDINEIERHVLELLSSQSHYVNYDLGSNIPELIADFLFTHQANHEPTNY